MAFVKTFKCSVEQNMLILPSMPTQAKQDALAPAWETRYFHSCCRSPASMFFYFHAVRPSTTNKGSSLVPSQRSVVGLDNVRTCSTNVKRAHTHRHTHNFVPVVLWGTSSQPEAQFFRCHICHHTNCVISVSYVALSVQSTYVTHKSPTGQTSIISWLILTLEYNLILKCM